MTRIAVIGLGTMGVPMARHLIAAGHELVGCDVVPAAADALGIPFAATPAEAVAGADFAITSLPSPAAVEEVCLGERGLAAGARPGTTVIEMSTSPPSLARRIAAELEPRGVDVLDAPVSGGPMGAEAATLSIMVGGQAEVFERARPLFEALGRVIVHLGPAGAGQAAKLCNNLVAGCTMAALAESCAIAEAEGLDPAQLYALMANGTGDSRVLRNRFPLAGVEPNHPSSREFAPLFQLDLIVKDLDLARGLAAEHGLATPVADTATARYREAQALGLGRLDYSAVYLAAGQQAGQDAGTL